MTNSITKPTLLILSFLMVLMLAVPLAVSAQGGTTTIDDRALDAAVEDMPQRESVQFEQPKATSGETTTGYTDKDGKPVSREELQRIRDDMDKGIFEKQPVISALVVLAIIGGITYAVMKRRKKSV